MHYREFVQEIKKVKELIRVITQQEDILSIEEFKQMWGENQYLTFPDVTFEETEKNIPTYYMVHLTKLWLEREAKRVNKHQPANKSSEKPYLKLVR